MPPQHSPIPGALRASFQTTPCSHSRACIVVQPARTHIADTPPARAPRADDDDATALELVSDRGAAIGEFDVVIDAAGL